MGRASLRVAFTILIPCGLLAGSMLACARSGSATGSSSETVPATPTKPPPTVETVTLQPTEPVLTVHRARPADFKPSVVYRWLDILLEASGRDVDRYGPRPPILSRTMAIVMTAMYDAWAAYDDTAVGTRLGGSLRRPQPERSAANKDKAIAQAAYRALLVVYRSEE